MAIHSSQFKKDFFTDFQGLFARGCNNFFFANSVFKILLENWSVLATHASADVNFLVFLFVTAHVVGIRQQRNELHFEGSTLKESF